MFYLHSSMVVGLYGLVNNYGIITYVTRFIKYAKTCILSRYAFNSNKSQLLIIV